MDGWYRLEHPDVEEQATVRIEAKNFIVCVPPQEPVVHECGSHDEARDEAGQKLVELMEAGWEIVHVETAESLREEEQRQEADEPFGRQVSDWQQAVLRHGPLVRINAEFGKPSPEAARWVVQQVIEEGVEELCIHGSALADGPWFATVEPWCKAVGSMGSKELRAFIIDTYYQPMTRQAGVDCGDITPILEGCPNLEFVHVIGHAKVRELRHDKLQRLTLMAESLDAASVRAILGTDCPRLLQLAIGFCYEQEADAEAVEAFAEAIEAVELPALTELHLACPGSSVQLVEALAQAPSLLSRLDGLCIHFASFEDVGPLLLAYAPVFASLQFIGIAPEVVDGMDDEDRVALKAALPGLVDSDSFDPFHPGNYYWERFEGRTIEDLPHLAKNLDPVERDDGNVIYYANISAEGLSMEEAARLQEDLQAELEFGDRSGMLNGASKMLISGMYAESIEAFRAIMKEYPDKAGDCLASIGAAYYFLGQFQRAIDYYEQAKEAGAPGDMMDENVEEARQALESN